MQQPGFFKRFGMAFVVFFKLLADAALAVRIGKVLEPEPEPEPEPAPLEDKQPRRDPLPAPQAAPTGGEAVRLLAALQREGRLVDFLQEELGADVSDQDVGAAARIVHEGCRKVLAAWFTVEPVWPGEEGTTVTVDEGFDARRVRLTGNVAGDPPFHGTLAHHGWRVRETRVPTVKAGAVDASVIAEAEVELP